MRVLKKKVEISRKLFFFSQAMARQYREKVETELREICNDVLALLDKETPSPPSHGSKLSNSLTSMTNFLFIVFSC